MPPERAWILELSYGNIIGFDLSDRSKNHKTATDGRMKKLHGFVKSFRIFRNGQKFRVLGVEE